MTSERFSLTTEDGHGIPVHHWRPAHPKAVVHIAHGMSEHSGGYHDVAERLVAEGYAVFAHDHRCHGEAIALQCLGQAHKGDWLRIVADMAVVNAAIRQRHPGLPIALLGHSMGSFISQAYCQTAPDDVDALLMEGSNYAAPWFLRLAQVIARVECWRQGDNGTSPVMDALSFGGFNKKFRPTRTDFDWLSRDAKFVDRYIADPLCGFQVSNRYWVEFLGGLAKASAPRNLRKMRRGMPVYLFAGDRDPVGGMGKGVKLLARKLKQAGLSPTLHLYPEARHDILHETNRDEILRDLLLWLATALGQETSSAKVIPLSAAR